MNEKELKKLSRGELMELLLELSRENSRLQAQLEQTQEQFRSRVLLQNQAGSMAEEAMQLSGVFQAVDAACQLYKENYQRLVREMAKNALRPQPEEDSPEVADEAEQFL